MRFRRATRGIVRDCLNNSPPSPHRVDGLISGSAGGLRPAPADQRSLRLVCSAPLGISSISRVGRLLLVALIYGGGPAGEKGQSVPGWAVGFGAVGGEGRPIVCAEGLRVPRSARNCANHCGRWSSAGNYP